MSARPACCFSPGAATTTAGGSSADGGRPDGEDAGPADTGGADDDWPAADGVTVDATAVRGDGQVDLTVTVTNTGGATVAVPDPATTPDRVGEAPDGTVRVGFLGVEAEPDAGDAAPTGEGVLIAPGRSHQATTGALGDDEVPSTLDVCVEVVIDVSAADVGDDGRVTLPARPDGEAPTVACSGPVPVA